MSYKKVTKIVEKNYKKFVQHIKKTLTFAVF